MDRIKILFAGGSLAGQRVLEDLAENEEMHIVGVLKNKSDKKTTWHDSIENVALKYRLNVLRKPDQILETERPDALVSILSEAILREPILSYPRHGCFNIHFALLPKHRGRYPLVHAILEGDPETGVTLHRMGVEVDGGEIIEQRRIKIEGSDTAHSLYMKSTQLAQRMTREFLDHLNKGKMIVGRKQLGTASYHDKYSFPEGEISLEWDAAQISRHARALYFPPYEPAYFLIDEKKFQVIPIEEK